MVGAKDVFESDVYGTIAQILVQMLTRSSKGTGMERQDIGSIDHNLTAEAHIEPLAGAMAKAAAPGKDPRNPRKLRSK